VRLHPGAFEDGAPLDADAVLDDHVRTDRNVGADAAVGADLGGRVLQNVDSLKTWFEFVSHKYKN
jgi:hypothetical protein